jgi:hypothetical protein
MDINMHGEKWLLDETDINMHEGEDGNETE